MAESLDLLVADSERATAAGKLRQHYDSGRLTLDELWALFTYFRRLGRRSHRR